MILQYNENWAFCRPGTIKDHPFYSSTASSRSLPLENIRICLQWSFWPSVRSLLLSSRRPSSLQGLYHYFGCLLMLLGTVTLFSFSAVLFSCSGSHFFGLPFWALIFHWARFQFQFPRDCMRLTWALLEAVFTLFFSMTLYKTFEQLENLLLTIPEGLWIWDMGPLYDIPDKEFSTIQNMNSHPVFCFLVVLFSSLV